MDNKTPPSLPLEIINFLICAAVAAIDVTGAYMIWSACKATFALDEVEIWVLSVFAIFVFALMAVVLVICQRGHSQDDDGLDM